jgi:hypothetical protein
LADRRETKVEAVKQQLSALAPVSGVWIKRMEAGAGASLEVETQLAAAELAQILVSDIAGWQIHAVTGRTVILGSPSSATTGIAAAMVEISM